MTETAGVTERTREKESAGLAWFLKCWIYNINFRDGQVSPANGTLMTENYIEPLLVGHAYRDASKIKIYPRDADQ